MKLKEILEEAIKNKFANVSYIGDDIDSEVESLLAFFEDRPWLLNFDLTTVDTNVTDYVFYTAKHPDWHPSMQTDGSKHWMRLQQALFVKSAITNKLVGLTISLRGVHSILNVILGEEPVLIISGESEVVIVPTPTPSTFNVDPQENEDWSEDEQAENNGAQRSHLTFIESTQL